MRKIFIILSVLGLTIFPALPLHAEDNLMTNSSVEESDQGLPVSWSARNWGDNDASFEYLNEGYDGDHSLKVELSRRESGDAKWVNDEISVEAGKTYEYKSFYKSNVDTEIDLKYLHEDGSVTYEFINIVPTSNDWNSLVSKFTVPETVNKVVIMHVLYKVGWLQTDAFSLILEEGSVPDGNLILNSSLEDSSGLAPLNWSNNAWGGTVSDFVYESYGHSGLRSITTTITDKGSGDAKWFADSVSVEPGKSYAYEDYYKSTIASRVVAAYLDSAGVYSYAELGVADVSSDWQKLSNSFTVPEGVVKVTIFHLIDDVGSLTIDDVSLKEVLPSSSVIPNGSLEETGDGSTPSNWQTNNWGDNSAQFDYLDEGRTGNKSVKVSVDNYVSGDAKWYFNPISTLESGEQYRFNVWYKTNVLPKAVVMYLKADGSQSYYGMPNPQPSADSASQWEEYSGTFSVPSDAVSLSVFLYVDQNGWLQTDDYSIDNYSPEGFSRPLLSLTFDDGHEDNVNTALPMMDSYGIKSTQCYATSFIEGIDEAVANVHAFADSGHEICSHTVNHPELTSLDSETLRYELEHSRDYLESITGLDVSDFATPYGDYNQAVNDVIAQYYGSHRTVDEGYNSKDNFDKYRLRVQNILNTTSDDQVAAWIAQAQADNTWLILVYHRVADDAGLYDTYTNVFAEQLQAIVNSGIEVKTYKDALSEVLSQM